MINHEKTQPTTVTRNLQGVKVWDLVHHRSGILHRFLAAIQMTTIGITNALYQMKKVLLRLPVEKEAYLFRLLLVAKYRKMYAFLQTVHGQYFLEGRFSCQVQMKLFQ